jgi:hypothetical protein
MGQVQATLRLETLIRAAVLLVYSKVRTHKAHGWVQVDAQVVERSG